MKVDRESILEWLETENRDREWLARQCDVGLSAIGNWLGKTNPRPIPSKAVVIIQNLMAADQAAKEARERTPQNLVLEFTDSEYSRIEQAAHGSGETLREWCKHTLNAAADDDIEAFAKKFAGADAIPFELPFFGMAAAGSPVISQLEGETVTVPKKYPAGYFVIEVNGQSMEPTLPDGSRIVCEPKEYTPRNGKICIVSDGHGSSVKRYDGKRKAFVSDNPDFPAFTPVDEVKLQGYFVEILSEP